MTAPRITLAEIKRAYARTGFRPTRRTWFFGTSFLGEGGQPHACPIAVLYCEEMRGFGLACGRAAERWARGRFGTAYAEGFLIGVDGRDRRSGAYLRHADYRDGLEDGRRVAGALWPKDTV